MTSFRRRIKNHIIYYLARVILFLVGQVPKRAVPMAGETIGRIASLIARREKKTAEAQLNLSYKAALTPHRLALLTRGLFSELSRNAVELARLLHNEKNRPDVHITDHTKRALDRALGQQKGVIFVTAHMGNWELMAIALAAAGYPISTVARTSYDPRFTRLIEQSRCRFGIEAIYRGSPGAPKAMLKALRQGRILGFLIDQDTKVPSTFVPFFGRPAQTPIGPAVFALRTGAPSVVGSIRRTRTGRHLIDVEEVIIPNEITAATARYTEVLEQRIRQRPSQWVWFHRRWKSVPQGGTQ